MELLKTFGKNLLNLLRTKKLIAAALVALATAAGLALKPELADTLANVVCDVIHCVEEVAE